MQELSPGAIAVIFVTRRNGRDPELYGAVAQRMNALAAEQPGFLGVHSVRDATSGEGITISYWADEAAAAAWRANAAHAAARERGRTRWYDYYHLIVGTVSRSHSWAR